MPVAAETLMVPEVKSAARPLKKTPGYNDSRAAQSADLLESSVLWRGFTSDLTGDDEYNMNLVRIFRRAPQNHPVHRKSCASLKPGVH